jgi:transcriptional regulator with XRE-family HTH domain
MDLNEKRNVIRIRRQAAELTQGELAKKAGINQSKLSLYENGLIDLTDAELQKVEKFLDAQPQKFSQLSDLAKPLSLKRSAFDEREMGEKYSPKLLRQRARLSQQELSRRTGIPRSRLSPWESGKGQLSESESHKVMDVLMQIVRKDPYVELEITYEANRRLWKSRRELLERLQALEKKHAAQVAAQAQEIAALREWYDAMEKAALAHANVEEASQKNPVEKLKQSIAGSSGGEIPLTVRQVIVTKRLLLKRTASEIASACGIDLDTYQKWEAGLLDFDDLEVLTRIEQAVQGAEKFALTVDGMRAENALNEEK